MFILKRQDVEISNIRHPEKDQTIPILSYQGQTFTLLNVFSAAQAEEARSLWRDLTDNRGKACVLLEEPERYSVWGKVRLDKAGGGIEGGDDGATPGHTLGAILLMQAVFFDRSEEHTSELQSLTNLVCRLLLEKKKIKE